MSNDYMGGFTGGAEEYSRELDKLDMVKCDLCGAPTSFKGTRRCNRCWELETRIQRDPELARKILATVTQ